MDTSRIRVEMGSSRISLAPPSSVFQGSGPRSLLSLSSSNQRAPAIAVYSARQLTSPKHLANASQAPSSHSTSELSATDTETSKFGYATQLLSLSRALSALFPSSYVSGAHAAPRICIPRLLDAGPSPTTTDACWSHAAMTILLVWRALATHRAHRPVRCARSSIFEVCVVQWDAGVFCSSTCPRACEMGAGGQGHACNGVRSGRGGRALDGAQSAVLEGELEDLGRRVEDVQLETAPLGISSPATSPAPSSLTVTSFARAYSIVNH
ncbi:hypothetical protein B0H17DRAFT_1152605 [Mycena rosella]|uniref:Uncharacterized protein n=1 Tax=Mycena rosella TaxID=1033263 RepID=A0AAD7FF74_MYCRO|nr:hypothetical protein B0H17DRAFT_1152605 [Mycena rosella]